MMLNAIQNTSLSTNFKAQSENKKTPPVKIENPNKNINIGLGLLSLASIAMAGIALSKGKKAQESTDDSLKKVKQSIKINNDSVESFGELSKNTLKGIEELFTEFGEEFEKQFNKIDKKIFEKNLHTSKEILSKHLPEKEVEQLEGVAKQLQITNYSTVPNILIKGGDEKTQKLIIKTIESMTDVKIAETFKYNQKHDPTGYNTVGKALNVLKENQDKDERVFINIEKFEDMVDKNREEIKNTEKETGKSWLELAMGGQTSFIAAVNDTNKLSEKLLSNDVFQIQLHPKN